MTAAGGVQVEGLDRLRRTMRQLGDDMANGWGAVNGRVASYVGATAATRAPRRSGLLAASWRPSGGKSVATVKFGGAAVPYANALHWGTGPRPGRRGPHNIAPSLFVTTAARDTEPVWFGYYYEALDAMLRQVRGK